MPLSSIILSRENLLHNISSFRNLAGNKKLCAVVKANAYGHGLKEIVSHIENKVDYFQLDDIEELRMIRLHTQIPVLLLGYVMDSELEEAIHLNSIPVLFEERQLHVIDSIGRKQNKKVPVHIEVDALLGRLGVPANEAAELLNELQKYPFVDCQYVYAHFSDIEDSDDLSHAVKQHQSFLKAIHKFPFHISATSGILTDPENSWGGDIIRLGIGTYGLWPSNRLKNKWQNILELKPVLSWKTKVAQVKVLPPGFPVGYGRTFITKKQSRIAIIPQGYSDGYDRALSNKGEVLIGNKRCAVLGRIAMNMFSVDTTEVPNVAVGDEVVLLGKQGTEEITADELASKIATINYEIVARISTLLPRTML